jgi:hypothetical protein
MDCQCAEELEDHITYNEIALRKHARGDWPGDWKTTRAEVVRQTRLLKSLGPVGRCRGHGRGMPDVSGVERGMHGFEGNCCHTTPLCPVCAGDNESEIPLAVLRELNALLAAGPA